MALSEYLTWDRHKLLTRLSELTEELAGLYVEVGYTRAAEFSAKADRWLSSHEDTITGRINDVSYTAAVETTSIMELDAKIRALTEEKFFVLKVLDLSNA